MNSYESAIVLFVFNRPEHTREVLEGLKRNNIKKLYVFCDGARNREEFQYVEQVQNLINDIDWCETEVDFNDENTGLARSVIKGVSRVFSKGYDSVIVLEDDCVPKENFVEFMEYTLKAYKDNEKVMHVSGFGLPIKQYTEPDVFLTPYPCSWGWGTWKTVWEECDFELYEEYENLLNDKELKKKFNYAGEGFSKFLSYHMQGKVNSWLIRWYYHIFSRDGLCVWNYKSLIENNGFDGSGEHQVKRDRFNQKNNDKGDQKTFKLEDELVVNQDLIREFRRFFIGSSLLEKIKTLVYMKTGLLIERKRRW
ncbi:MULTISPECIES: glycosyltransferase [Bacillus cereus group]|uniref:Glycosyltransferase n=1 Tax=Bacillus paramobilis TaxID=2817477 RepID=A0ABZ2VP99_9BACI|nr:glycosyltransferase [Bacillus wiedmannii]EJS74037.1 hypothetical protein ICW_00293 [Bacillus wiedmannii]PEA43371.1 sugar transferase [Bacillus wiedmannii]